MPVRKTGGEQSRWFVDFRFQGRRIRKRSPVQTELGAMRYERELKSLMVERDETGRVAFFWESPTFSRLAAEWRVRHLHVHNRPSTIATHSGILDQYLLPELGQVPIEAITTERVDILKMELCKHQLSAKTVNNILSVLHSCLQVGVDWGKLRKVPKFRWLKAPVPPFTFLRAEEVIRLLASTSDPFWRTFILFLVKTGCRFGEAAGLHWDDVDLESGKRVLIRRSAHNQTLGPTKTGQIRHIPLAPDLAQALSALPRAYPHVFPGAHGMYLDSRSTLKHLQESCDHAQIKQVSWHDLRHTFATQLVTQNVHLRVIQQLLGHCTLEMTARYAHVSDTAATEAVTQLAF